MTDQEMHSLYKDPKIKALVSLTHGEGFGLPLFEAAYSGLPVVAPEWSGHVDFLSAPKKNKKSGSEKLKAHFARIDYDIAPIPEHSVWEGVLEKDSSWCYPKQGSYKMKLREVYKEYGRFKKQAKDLQKWVVENFSQKDKKTLMLEGILGQEYINTLEYTKVKVQDIPKISLITSVFKANEHIAQLMENITSQSIFKDKCEWIILNANDKNHTFEEEIIQKYVEKYPDNIKYKRLDTDPGVYGVWNEAIKMSTGEFVTNINCDDRRKSDALEQQAKLLFFKPDVDLVYNDSYIVQEANQTWEDIKQDMSKYNFEQFSKQALLRQNLPHNNPMWRKSLHDKNGYFDDKYKSAADWDFWLRCAFAGSKFIKHPETLGVYYFNPLGISTNPENNSWKKKEEFEVYKKFQKIYMLEEEANL